MTRAEAILRARAEVQLIGWIVNTLILEFSGTPYRVGWNLDPAVRSAKQDLADESVSCLEGLSAQDLCEILERSLPTLESLVNERLKFLRPLVVELYAAVQRLRNSDQGREE